MEAGPGISLSPSFNSYSNSQFAEIAARVVEEFDSNELIYEEFNFEREEITEYVNNEDEDEEFQFPFVARDSKSSSPISADELFHNGQIRPIYPIFDPNLLIGHVKFEKENDMQNSDSPRIRFPLRKLFFEERETALTTSSSSSSDVNNLDGLPAGTYCVWLPKKAGEEAAEGRCKKSSSTGSNSKRWKFKDLLYRSQSEGSKESFIFFSPSHNGSKIEKEKLKVVRGGKLKSSTPPLPPLYNRNNGGEKWRSYLPYRQDLVGFFR